jgi:hypothetical protein
MYIKSILFSLVLSSRFFCSVAQGKLVKDLDFDKQNDTVYVDRDQSVIVCRLSSQNFKKITSLPIDVLNEQSGVQESKNGFTFYNDWMRAGYKNQFRYDVKTQRMQLIGMSRYEFGNATNDGSGESSVNLLTNDYKGDWNYFDQKKKQLVKIPTIATKLVLPKTYLETFGEETYFGFAEKCTALYEKHKALARKPR